MTKSAKLIELPHHSFVIYRMAVGRSGPRRRSGMRPRLPQPVVLYYGRYKHESGRSYFAGFSKESALQPRPGGVTQPDMVGHDSRPVPAKLAADV